MLESAYGGDMDTCLMATSLGCSVPPPVVVSIDAVNALSTVPNSDQNDQANEYQHHAATADSTM